MLKKIASFHKRPFIRNVATVATGSVIAQAVAVAFSPIITRLYGPEAFGVLGIFVSLTAILVPVSSLTYQVAIVLPADDKDAKGLLALSLVIAAGVSVLLILFLLIFGAAIVELLQIQAISSFVLLIPIVTFFSAGAQVLQQWMIRTKQYKTRAALEIANTLSINSLNAGAGFFWPSSISLIFIATFGNLLNMLMLAAGSLKTLCVKPAKISKFYCPSARQLFHLAKHHKDFPKFRAPTVLVSSMTRSLPVLFLTGLFGPASAGFYALGLRLLSMPGQIIGKAIGDVFYPRITEAANKGENIQRLIIRTVIGKVAVGIVPYGLVSIFGPWLFGLVFGSEWVTAGEYARWLSLWTFFMFVSSPCVLSVPVLEMQGLFLAFQMVYDASRILSLYLGYIIFKTDVATVSLFCIVGAVFHVFITIFIITKAHGWQKPIQAH